MEEAAVPLLEKETLAMLDLDAKIARSRSSRPAQSRRLRVFSALLPLGLVLGVVFFVFAWRHHSCSSSPQTHHTPLLPEMASASISASKRSEREGDTTQPVTATSATRTATASATTVLDCFQVAPPVLTPDGPATDKSPRPSTDTGAVTVTLMDHVFGNSYNAPFVGSYVPLSKPFNRVVMNFTVVSEGRQFDRLALMYLNDTEVWRTSTAEPVKPPGIRWVYLKDMTAYLALWRSPQKIIFDLGNLQNDVYTGSFNATLTATFFQSDDVVAPGGDGAAPPSDIIIPISARKSAVNGVSQFTLPADTAANTIGDFPRNARRAVFSVSANGQAAEEFWWANVLQSDTLTFNTTENKNNVFPGFSPFREVQVRIDGQLAGVQWPFPVIFTGGVVPGLHRPIAGIDVFDLREHEIDISPWLPLLCDGQPHTFSIQVAGIDDDGQASGGTATLTETVAASWYVTGKIFVWLDGDAESGGAQGGGQGGASAITTGLMPVVNDAGPTISVTQHVLQNATGANETLQYTVSVARSFSVQGVVMSGSPNKKASRVVSWSQSLSYSNQGVLSNFGNNQVNTFTVHGSDRATGRSADDSSAVPYAYAYSADYAYPVFCNTTTDVTAQGNLTLWADLDQGLRMRVSGAGVFPVGLEAFSGSGSRYADGAQLDTRVQGTAWFYQTGDGKNSTGFGTTSQTMRLGGFSSAGMLGATPDVALYFRNVKAVNQSILFDHEVIAGSEDVSVPETRPASAALSSPAYQFAQAPLNGGTGVRAFMGRGGANPEVAVGTEGGPANGNGGVPAAAVAGQAPLNMR
ncbi:hypothetical protein SCUCBS95973_009228 [Sporothrix curviconia]|uniref:Peptide N-acetyl-beta-D-glucosaminyl asparaginase amidase A N-terminal domain-containing protein n=1 Tax=Sporothrix curviconia TaxID=1260050 RepID=A0ABP0CT96_9PEZI